MRLRQTKWAGRNQNQENQFTPKTNRGGIESSLGLLETTGMIEMNNPNDGRLEKWSEKHFGELALWRTVGQGLNIVLSLVVIAKLFGWI